MSFSLATAIQASNVITSAGGVVTVSISANAGELVVIGMYWSSVSFTSIAVDSGETISLGAIQADNNNVHTIRMGRFIANSSGSRTITLTLTGSGFARQVLAIAFACGGGGPAFVDADNTIALASSISVSLTASANNLLVGYALNLLTDPTAGSGFTSVAVPDGTNALQTAEYDLDAGGAGSKTVDFGTDNSAFSILVAMSFEELSGDITVNADGVSATGATGDPSVSGGASVALTGVAATGAVGDVIAGAQTAVSVTGVSATGDVGNVTVTGGAGVSVTGVQATGAAGTASVEFPITHSLARHRAPVGYAGYLARHRAPVGYRALARHRALWSLMGSQLVRHRASWDLLTHGLARHRAVYDLSATNHGLARHRAGWSLLSNPVTVATSRPFLEHAGTRLELLDLSISQAEGGQFWNLRASLARAADYLRLSRLDAIALEIFGDRYELVVETLGRSSANRAVDQRFDVSCRSPLWATLGEPGDRVTRTWPAVMARAVVEELAGEAVDWRITDWQIPAGVLAAVNETAITVIERIVGAAGGVVESAKDGGLICRYRYPVSIPQAATATPDHALTEAVDIYELAERIDERQAFDRIALTDEATQRGYLSAERDDDQPDVILAGESQKFLVFHSPDVEIQQILQSDGTLIDLGPAAVSVEDEEIVFANTDRAEVARIASSGFSYAWFGAGLGALTVGSDRRKLIAGAAGVGVARVSYTAEGHRYAVLSPTSSGGRTEFPIIVYVIGALREDEVSSVSPVRIVVQRGAGAIPGDDIVDPLMGPNENVMLNRGRNEIDGAAAKGQVTITAAYPVEITDSAHVVNGELLLVEDSQLGAAWRGKARDIEHRVSVDQRSGAIFVNSNIAAERFL